MADTMEQRIKNFIAQEYLNGRPASALDGNLIEQEIIDSLGIIMLISFVEEQFDAKVEPQDVVIENFETVEAISALVRRRQMGVQQD